MCLVLTQLSGGGGAELTRAWRWEVTLGHGEGFLRPDQPRCPGEAVGESAPEASPPGEQRRPIRPANQPPPRPELPQPFWTGGAVLTPSPLNLRVSPQRGASLSSSRTGSGPAGWGPVGARLGLGLGGAASSLQTLTCWGWSPGRSRSSPACRGKGPGWRRVVLTGSGARAEVRSAGASREGDGALARDGCAQATRPGAARPLSGAGLGGWPHTCPAGPVCVS